MTFPKFTQAQLDNFVTLLNQRSKAISEASTDTSGSGYYIYTAEYRTKFVRIMQAMYHKDGTPAGGSRSVHCFIDADGNILKAASLNKPAKGVRGNILAEDPLAGTNIYGAEYFR